MYDTEPKGRVSAGGGVDVTMSSDFYGPGTTRSSGFDKGRDRDRDSRPDGREGGAGSRQQEREPKRQRGHGDDESSAGGVDVTLSSDFYGPPTFAQHLGQLIEQIDRVQKRVRDMQEEETLQLIRECEQTVLPNGPIHTCHG